MNRFLNRVSLKFKKPNFVKIVCVHWPRIIIGGGNTWCAAEHRG